VANGCNVLSPRRSSTAARDARLSVDGAMIGPRTARHNVMRALRPTGTNRWLRWGIVGRPGAYSSPTCDRHGMWGGTAYAYMVDRAGLGNRQHEKV